MTRRRFGSAIGIIAAAAALAACGSSGKKLASPTTSLTPSTTVATTPPPISTTANYHPKIDPAKFTDHITNAYLPLIPGTTHRYRGKRDGVPTETVVTVTRGSRTIMGVRCVVVTDIVTQSHSLAEKTTDWYAQDDAGNVWYFGENTAEYQNGVVTTTAGTWEAGVDKALPGIVMMAAPKVGQTFRQEYRPGVALDIATILGVNGTARVPAGTFRHLVITFDKNPLDPSKKEHKFYARGVGFVHAVLKGGGHAEITGLVK